ncbi:MAG: DUF2817 domain-containing protein [Thermoplasmatales archaeon]|nr:MAG: DUF2817 domain-containing protein [Thermoplasmatales archaeon]
MVKPLSQLKLLFLISILFIGTFTGCVEEEQKKGLEKQLTTEIELDQPFILPDWKDGEYHDYYGTMQTLNELNEKYPNLVYVHSIGESVLGKDIWCIRITNEGNDVIKSSCIIDGCIHGNEWEGGEACLYLAEYLLINFGNNATISHILNTTEVYIVPLLNPDGRQNDKRWNENGIDLNRNFDVDFGRLRGRCLRIGKLFGRIKIPYINFPRRGFYTNCGRRPFSEPETKAVSDLIKRIDHQDFSFYLSCHTAAHNIISPWGVFKPPFEMTQQEKSLFDHVMSWVDENTEYEPGGEFIWRGKKVYMSGTAVDWCFQEFRIPCFTFEILSTDYEPWLGKGKHDHLVHWMKTTLPVFMYFLVNIDNLRQWKAPDIQPTLPEGIPPPPLH